jgi:hypothetical protein
VDLHHGYLGTWISWSQPVLCGRGAALEALDERVDVVGTSGFTTREDVLLATASPNADKLVKGA